MHCTYIAAGGIRKNTIIYPNFYKKRERGERITSANNLQGWIGVDTCTHSHERIFVNNIRGNLIICLLHCFNFERFFSPPNPRSVADTPTRSVQFNVFTRGEVRLVGGRFPSGVGNERLATLRRIREIVRE